VGLSNRRLVALDERGVTFRTRGQNTVSVSPDDFLRRFVLHVLPKGFVKIRHHGLMAPSNVTTKLVTARRLLDSTETTATELVRPRGARDFREVLLALTGMDFRGCPRCGGTMHRHPLGVLETGGVASSVTTPDTS
jgi:hypothetical protein